jgi:hypothetical protein
MIDLVEADFGIRQLYCDPRELRVLQPPFCSRAYASPTRDPSL